MWLVLLAACSEPVPPGKGGDDTADWPGPDPSTYRTSLVSAAEVGQLTDEARRVKFTAPIDGIPREEPIVEDCYFQDMVAWPWHMMFLRAFPELADLDVETYTAWVVANDTRRWWGGEVMLLPGTLHPVTGLPGVFGFVFWSDDSGGGSTVAQVVEVWTRVRTCAPWAGDLAVWIPDGSAQAALAAESIADLEAAGIPWLDPTYVRESMRADTLVEGTAEGPLGTGGILVADTVPDDVSGLRGLVVGDATGDEPGVETLRAQGAPVSVSAWALDNALIDQLTGASVVMEASDSTLLLYPARTSETQ